MQVLPDGSAVVWGGPDGFLRFWRWTNGNEKAVLIQAHKANVSDMAFSSDGRWAATASSDQSIKLFDMGTLRELDALQGHEDRMSTLAFSSDNQWLASGSLDRTVKLWNVERRRAATPIVGVASTGMYSFQFSPDSKTMAVSMDNGTIKLFEADSLREIGSVRADCPLAFTVAGQKLVTVTGIFNRQGAAGHSLQIWNVGTRMMERKVELPPLATSLSYYSAVLSPDESLVAVADGANVRLCDVNSGRETTNLSTLGSAVVMPAFSPDGRTLCALDKSGLLHFWDVRSASVLRRTNAHSKPTMTMGISADGKLVATATRGQIRLWDMATGALRGELAGHRQGIYSLAFSPDGTTLASSSSDGTVKLWSLSIRQEVCTIPFYEKRLPNRDPGVNDIRFAPDGNSLWTLGDGGELKVWRTASWAEIQASEKEARSLTPTTEPTSNTGNY